MHVGHLQKVLVCLAVYICIPWSAYAQTRTVPKDDLIQSLQVFPNPNSGKFNINVREQEHPYDINVYNLIGKMIYHWESVGTGSANIEVDLSRQPEGIYFVELDNDKENALKRIVLEHAK